mgnify:CR=1 FL=1
MKKLPAIWIAPVLLLATLLALFLYYPVVLSLKKAFFPVDEFSLQFFALFFKNRLLLQSVLTSFALGIVVTVLCLVVSLPLA